MNNPKDRAMTSNSSRLPLTAPPWCWKGRVRANITRRMPRKGFNIFQGLLNPREGDQVLGALSRVTR